MQEVFLKIYGEVHGVGFRYSAKLKAADLTLTGWVKNARDGTLEMVAQGERSHLETFVSWAKTGPRFAKVEKLEINWRETTTNYPSFEILPE